MKQSSVEEQSANLKMKTTFRGKLQSLRDRVCVYGQDLLCHLLTPKHPLSDGWHAGDTMFLTFVVLTYQFVFTFLQQANLKSAVAMDKEGLTTLFVVLQTELEVAKKHILHRVLEREDTSHRSQQVLEDQLKTKFEVMRQLLCQRHLIISIICHFQCNFILGSTCSCARGGSSVTV